MIISQSEHRFPQGYTEITAIDGPHANMLMDFGILVVGTEQPWTGPSETERAFLLLRGDVTLNWHWDGNPATIRIIRSSVLDEEPTVLHVPKGTEVTIVGHAAESEIAIQGVRNEKKFPPRVWKPGEYRSERFGEGTLQDTSTRLVRTVFDAATAPESEMVLGEVINHPGKWSSYPPHDHAQPEVYHYRFFPEQGFGHAEKEDEVFKVRNLDSYAIPPGVTHSQCAAPGYVMYYIWMIPHLRDDRFGPDSRIFRKEHAWVMDSAAPIWPDASLDAVQEYQESQNSQKENR